MFQVVHQDIIMTTRSLTWYIFGRLYHHIEHKIFRFAHKLGYDYLLMLDINEIITGNLELPCDRVQGAGDVCGAAYYQHGPVPPLFRWAQYRAGSWATAGH